MILMCLYSVAFFLNYVNIELHKYLYDNCIYDVKYQNGLLLWITGNGEQRVNFEDSTPCGKVF